MTIDGNKKIIFLALRDIERGEEITYALAVQRTTWHYDFERRG
jgi:SET domain-containing protein